jgi:hypothetical protein
MAKWSVPLPVISALRHGSLEAPLGSSDAAVSTGGDVGPELRLRPPPPITRTVGFGSPLLMGDGASDAIVGGVVRAASGRESTAAVSLFGSLSPQAAGRALGAPAPVVMAPSAEGRASVADLSRSGGQSAYPGVSLPALKQWAAGVRRLPPAPSSARYYPVLVYGTRGGWACVFRRVGLPSTPYTLRPQSHLHHHSTSTDN